MLKFSKIAKIRFKRYFWVRINLQFMAFFIILLVQMRVSICMLTFVLVSLLTQTSNSALLGLNVDLSTSTSFSTSADA